MQHVILMTKSVTVLFVFLVTVRGSPSFTLDLENNGFLRNGIQHRYVAGSMHYFRVQPGSWRDRMEKMRVAGLNTLQTYVEWSSHEQQPGVFTFSGMEDIEKYLDTAKQVGLDVILRPGPFIDAERDFGGLPFWLLSNRSSSEVKLRTAEDKFFMTRLESWYKVLFTKLEKHLFVNGGPIIMVQVENEYGSYGLQTGHCDKEYLVSLRDMIRSLVGDSVLLFSTDGAGSDMVMCGKVPGVYSTVDFGCSSNVKQAFQVQRLFEPKGPLVNSEYYPGWLDHWETPHSQVDTNCVVKTLFDMLDMGASVNIYMFHGGTSFGFSAGSNTPPFRATPTSYDYDAPITEAGDLTTKFWAIREAVGRYLPLPPLPPSLQNISTKAAYGRVEMTFVTSLLDTTPGPITRTPVRSELPPSFESLGQTSGLVIYETTLPNVVFTDPVLLSVQGLRDRGTVFIDRKPVGVLSRTHKIFSLPLQVTFGQKLTLVVESQGRVCFGPDIADYKGILGNVTLGHRTLTGWTSTGVSLAYGHMVDRYTRKVVDSAKQDPVMKHQLALGLARSEGKFTFWRGQFRVGAEGPLDTFLRLPDWHKGVAFINGFNLGRYWPVVGPQKTLYVPASLLNPSPAYNSLVLLEQDHVPCLTSTDKKCWVEMVDKPDINGPTPEIE